MRLLLLTLCIILLGGNSLRLEAKKYFSQIIISAI